MGDAGPVQSPVGFDVQTPILGLINEGRYLDPLPITEGGDEEPVVGLVRGWWEMPTKVLTAKNSSHC